MKIIKSIIITALIFSAVVASSVIWIIHLEVREIPLVQAASQRNWNKVRILLRDGVNPNETSDRHNHRTALYYAILDGNVPIVRLLIKKGVNVNQVDTHGDAALDWANFDNAKRQQAQRLEILSLLRKQGARSGREIK